MPANVRLAVGLALSVLAASTARAEQSNEDRMRDALRQAVTEMRAAQDQAAQAQADLAKAQGEKTALQAQLDAANSKPAAKPEELTALQDQIKQLQAQAANLAAINAKLQGTTQSLADTARTKDDEARAAEAGLKANTKALETCKAANTKLISVSEDVLHLYQTESFRALLLKSYEPIVGAAKVRLENLVQDYDDKIRDQEYVAPRGK